MRLVRYIYMKKLIFTILGLALCLIVTSCGGTKMSVADEQMARGEYFDASKTYRKIYNKLTKREERPLRGEVAYKMGEAHRMLSQWSRAGAAYQNALRYGCADSLAQLRLAQMLHAEGKYAQAVAAYEQYLMLNPASPITLRGLEGAKWAAGAKANPTRYVVKSARQFNTRRSDFSPMFNGDILYFTTTNEKVTGNNRSEITGMKKSDIWMSRKDERGRWQRPEPVEGELNTEMDEGIVSFSPDGNTMYLTKARRLPNANTAVEIFTSQRSDAQWSAARKFEVTPDTVSSVGHPAVSPSGEYLYFASDMPGCGGKDIWRISLKDSRGSLENLGTDINTPGNEEFPYMLTDSIMYFASDGHPGFGGLDIFQAALLPSGRWKVTNMGAPVNSASDDFGITFAKSDHPEGFFSSNRGDSRGYDHIYSFELPDLKISINGWVIDHDDEPIPGAAVRIVGNDGSMQRTATGANGEFSFKLQRGVSYAMLAGARGYLNGRQEFTTDTAETDADYEIEFMLASLNKPNIVENIFYDFDKATLRSESKDALDKLVTLLKDNPNITIEMSSHTDRVGTEEYNIDLSDRRAKAVVDYLIKEGIAAERLQYHGFGKSRPKTVSKRNATQFPQFKEGDILTEEFILSLPEEADREAADQINRRTEFTVLSVDYNMY